MASFSEAKKPLKVMTRNKSSARVCLRLDKRILLQLCYFLYKFVEIIVLNVKRCGHFMAVNAANKPFWLKIVNLKNLCLVLFGTNCLLSCAFTLVVS